jgi:hypothetical protein
MSLSSELTSASKLIKAGQLDSAFDCCKRALKLPGGDDTCNLHLCFGAIFSARDEPDLAEKAFVHALEIEPESVQALKGMCKLLEAYEGERLEELVPLYEKLVQLDKSAKPADKPGKGKASDGDKASKGKAADWSAKLAAAQVALGGSRVDYSQNYGDGDAAATRGGDKKAGAKGGAHGEEPEPSAPADRRRVAASKRSSGDGEAGKEADLGAAVGDVEATLRAELADLRAKVAEGTKLSGKQKRQLKKLEDAEARWKEYKAVGEVGEDGAAGDASQPGSQFTAEVRGRAEGGAAPGAMGDGIEIAEFSIRANAVELLVDAREWCPRRPRHPSRRCSRPARPSPLIAPLGVLARRPLAPRRAAIRPHCAQRQGQDDPAEASRERWAAWAASLAGRAVCGAGGRRVRRVRHPDPPPHRHQARRPRGGGGAPRGGARGGDGRRGGRERWGGGEGGVGGGVHGE